MSAHPGGSRDQHEPSDVDMKAVLYALHANGFYPDPGSILRNWSPIMQWWHGLEPVTWLEEQTGWTCALKGTHIGRKTDHGAHPEG